MYAFGTTLHCEGRNAGKKTKQKTPRMTGQKVQPPGTEQTSSQMRQKILQTRQRAECLCFVCAPIIKENRPSSHFFISIPLFHNGQLAFWVKWRQTKHHFRHESILIRLITAGCQQRLAPVIKNRKLLEGKQARGACAVHYDSLNSS